MTALEHSTPNDGGWADIAGLTCTCPPGCTVGEVWGDGPRACVPGCRPCRIMAGRPYVKRKKTRPKPSSARARTGLYEKPIEIDQ